MFFSQLIKIYKNEGFSQKNVNKDFYKRKTRLQIRNFMLLLFFIIFLKKQDGDYNIYI